MSDQVKRSPMDLRRRIAALPEGRRVYDANVWYRSQKEHWLGWLGSYDGPGGYGRKVHSGRDARFVYNHVVNPQMLFWLVEASGVESAFVDKAREYEQAGPSLMSQSAWIRRHVKWETVEAALWPDRPAGFFERLIGKRAK